MRRFFIFLMVAVTLLTAVVAPASAQQPAECTAPAEFLPFTPDTATLADANPVAPDRHTFLTAHGLNADMVQGYVPTEPAIWEPGLHVVELVEDLYGDFCLTLQPGWVYTVALEDGRVEVIWGGDPAVQRVPVLWGFSARYLPSYLGKLYGLGGWLSVENPIELLVREHRYGRYLRNEELAEMREDVPYFDRVGPYWTGTGNTATEWVPPALTAHVPRDYRDAAALLGGLARPNEWTHDPETGVWVWRYTDKVPGSADYCSPNDSCWQVAYVPPTSEGYIEGWVDTGPRRFYADEWVELLGYPFDEFSYHPDGD